MKLQNDSKQKLAAQICLKYVFSFHQKQLLEFEGEKFTSAKQN